MNSARRVGTGPKGRRIRGDLPLPQPARDNGRMHQDNGWVNRCEYEISVQQILLVIGRWTYLIVLHYVSVMIALAQNVTHRKTSSSLKSSSVAGRLKLLPALRRDMSVQKCLVRGSTTSKICWTHRFWRMMLQLRCGCMSNDCRHFHDTKIEVTPCFNVFFAPPCTFPTHKTTSPRVFFPSKWQSENTVASFTSSVVEVVKSTISISIVSSLSAHTTDLREKKHVSSLVWRSHSVGERQDSP